MTSGYSFKGYHCSEFGLWMKSKKRQLLPGSNDTYVQVPGRDGTYLFPGELQDRSITIECAWLDSSLQSRRINARKIAAWLWSHDREILSFDDEIDKYYMAKLESPIDPEDIALLTIFTLEFRCEPLAYAGEHNAAFTADTTTLMNSGTKPALPRYSVGFTAAASEWKVTGPGGSYTRVVHEFAINDQLEVNTATGAILINGTRAMKKLDWQNSQFFYLRVGENTLNIAPIGKCETRVYWVPRYL